VKRLILKRLILRRLIWSLLLGVASVAGLGCRWAGAAAFEIDSSHTGVYFAASHFERTLVRGRFLGIKGKIEFDAASHSGSFDLDLDPERIDTGLRGLDAVLRSAQFFDTKEYPLVRFQSTRFEFDGEQLRTVHGMLSMHGVTLPLQLKTERFSCGEVKIVLLRRFVCGGEFRAQISRSSFGMRQFLPDVGDTVWLDIAVEASPVN
jgi:polyisoprenoid-binding protein YceI